MIKNLLLIIGVLICFIANGQSNGMNYDYVKNIKKGFQFVIKANCWGLINKEGELILPMEYDDIASYTYKKNYVFIHKNKATGLFSLDNGKIIIPPLYGYIEMFKRKGVKGFKAYGKNYQVVEFSLEGNIEKTYKSQCFYTCLDKKDTN